MGKISQLKQLLKNYKKKKKEIEKRIFEFKKNSLNKEKIKQELCFCICAANSTAKAAYKAELRLKKNKLLDSSNKNKISFILKKSGVRFHNKKAVYVIKAIKKLFKQKKFFEYLKTTKNEFELRSKLVKEIDGLGLKEASHFLRNIGMMKNLAILDRHILKCLKYYGVIKEIPKTLTKKNYLEIEKRMIEFSKKIKIEPAKIDLLFWSEQTGYVFK